MLNNALAISLNAVHVQAKPSLGKISEMEVCVLKTRQISTLA